MYNIETFNWIATNVNKTQTFTHKMVSLQPIQIYSQPSILIQEWDGELTIRSSIQR